MKNKFKDFMKCFKASKNKKRYQKEIFRAACADVWDYFSHEYSIGNLIGMAEMVDYNVSKSVNRKTRLKPSDELDSTSEEVYDQVFDYPYENAVWIYKHKASEFVLSLWNEFYGEPLDEKETGEFLEYFWNEYDIDEVDCFINECPSTNLGYELIERLQLWYDSIREQNNG